MSLTRLTVFVATVAPVLSSCLIERGYFNLYLTLIVFGMIAIFIVIFSQKHTYSTYVRVLIIASVFLVFILNTGNPWLYGIYGYYAIGFFLISLKNKRQMYEVYYFACTSIAALSLFDFAWFCLNDQPLLTVRWSPGAFGFDRISPVFNEMFLHCLFLSPYIYINIIKRDKKFWLGASSLLLSQSAGGVLLFLFTFVMAVFRGKNLPAIILSSILIFSLANWFKIISKITDFGGSSYHHIFGSIQLFKSMGLKEIFVGVGYDKVDQIAAEILTSPITTIGLVKVLLGIGVFLSVFLFLGICIILFQKRPNSPQCVVVGFFLISCVKQPFFFDQLTNLFLLFGASNFLSHGTKSQKIPGRL